MEPHFCAHNTHRQRLLENWRHKFNILFSAKLWNLSNWSIYSMTAMNKLFKILISLSSKCNIYKRQHPNSTVDMLNIKNWHRIRVLVFVCLCYISTAITRFQFLNFFFLSILKLKQFQIRVLINLTWWSCTLAHFISACIWLCSKIQYYR